MITVYKYHAEKTSDFDEAAMHQLRLAHELRNRMVQLDQEVEKMIQDIWASHPALQDLDAAVKEANEAVTAAYTAVSESKKVHRKVDKDLAAALRAARNDLRAAKATFRERRELVRSAVKPELRAMEMGRRAGLKDLYGEFCTEKGLFWATYGQVRDKYEVSRSQVIKLRKQGRPAALRFHRWTGEGTLTVVLQRPKDAPPRDPVSLPTSRWRNILTIPHLPEAEWEALTPIGRKDWARDRTPGLSANPGRPFRMRSGTHNGEKCWLDLQVAWTRPLPDNADIVMAQVTRRMVAGKPRITVAITVKLDEDPPPRHGPAIAAVNLGWRATENGLRVATIVSNVGLTEPPEGSWVVPISRREVELVIPQSILDSHNYCESIDSIRSKLVLELRAFLLENVQHLPKFDDLDYGTLGLWTSPSRFAALALRWRPIERVTAEELNTYTLLEGWRKQDKHLWQLVEGISRRKIAQRKEQFRITAKWLVSQSPLVVFGDIELAQLARTPDIIEDDTVQAKLARRNRTIAASGDFKMALMNRARSHGGTVKSENPAYSTIIHRGCGAELDPDELRASLHVRCPGCNAWVDQDVNAAQHLLELATSPRIVSPGGARRDELLDAHGGA